MKLLKDLLINDDSVPAPDMCSCANCGWKGKASDCEQAKESEDREYPPYWIHLCPAFDDGTFILGVVLDDEPFEALLSLLLLDEPMNLMKV